MVYKRQPLIHQVNKKDGLIQEEFKQLMLFTYQIQQQMMNQMLRILMILLQKKIKNTEQYLKEKNLRFLGTLKDMPT